MSNFLKTLRNNKGVNQEVLAKKLGVSRPTYIQIENGSREMLVNEALILAKFFDLSLEDFLAEKVSKEPIVEITKEKIPKAKKQEERISVPQKNIQKFKEVLLYILEKVGAKANVGETVIYKLLYFIDFDFYEKYEEQLIGATYIKNTYGPTPIEFKEVIKIMQKDGEIELIKNKFFNYPQRKYLPRKNAVLKSLSALEKEHIDEVLNRSISGTKLVDMTANQISEYSHGDLPWKAHQMGEKIDYESVFYRNDPYSVKEFADEL